MIRNILFAIRKRIGGMAILALFSTAVQADDAFHGILPVTDRTMMRSLNGEWALKVIEGTADTDEVPAQDGSWGKIPVPGCWEAYGYCKPSYDKANPLTGYYRTTFSVPTEWKGKRIVLRLDGVLYGYDLWINGKKAGSWRSGYNTALFDITPYINKKNGEQELAMKVITRFPGSDFDYNDDWAPSGIFRDVTLMAVPETHLSDLTVHAKLNGEVSVDTEIANAKKGTTVKHEIYDMQGNMVGTSKVDNPQLWTAETPYLYTLRTMLMQKKDTLQVFTNRFGFRETTIEGNVLKLNGKSIKLRGVTCHSTDPVTVKVINEESILRDMKLMKEASVNYIRTSHYPREPRFYELADSLGFYVIDEVPFGFGDKLLSDTAYYPVLQQRAQATIRRDKNHPSVIIWSLGNENPLTDICVRLGEYVSSELDPSRPYCYPQVGSYFRRFFEGENAKGFPSKAPIYSPHYPTTGQIAGFYQHRDRPVIFTEYCHTLGISLEDHDRQWEIIQRTPGIAGGSVWEWVDQGMPFKDSLDNRYGYEEKVFTSDNGGFEMYGNKGTDGLLYADRTPLPNYYELRRNYARAFVSSLKGNVLTIVNRYDFLNLKDNVTFRWTLTCDRDTVRTGAFTIDCAPHDSATYRMELPEQTGLSLLCFDVVDAQGHEFLEQSFVMNKPSFSVIGTKGTNTDTPSFLVRVGRKATMAELIKVGDKRIERYLQPVGNPYVKADIKTKKCPDGSLAVNYTLTPDTTTDRFLSEIGVAWLLPKEIDHVQWLGMGPLASYPGRCKANNYNIWSLHKDDLYFEGNRMGIDAAFFSDKDGNGILVVGDSLNMNFEQTDRGIVVTVNAAVSGQGPKFARTAFPVTSKNTDTLQGSFRICAVKDNELPQAMSFLLSQPKTPFKPFLTQYDTYLMRYDDITEGTTH
ncbi:MAG: glycoside hydrolase family 2 TIM barrel-domain containing protein [Prevotella sp.]|nr:glycoside hydrolase family 2 TIM barrel-domain containing protein [Prevotella sp.]